MSLASPLRVGLCTAILAVALSRAPGATPTQPAAALPRELGWIGLFNNELVGWLENENRLNELCLGDQGSSEWHECRAAYMEPKVAVIPVRSAPRVDARRVGEIVLLAAPGRGLRMFASAGRVAQRFTPDLFDEDWGYGPYFHQTILARRESWFRIPVPLMGAGWINAEEWSDRGELGSEKTGPRTETVREGQIITSPRGDMFVLGIENRVLRVRPEQDADMWCEAGTPPPLAPWQEVRIPFDQLFDSKGHLLISYKYKRGC